MCYNIPRSAKNCECHNFVIKNVYSCITERYFTYGEYTHTLRLTSKLVDLRVGYAKRIQELHS